jgi:hypothetical protein
MGIEVKWLDGEFGWEHRLQYGVEGRVFCVVWSVCACGGSSTGWMAGLVWPICGWFGTIMGWDLVCLWRGILIYHSIMVYTSRDLKSGGQPPGQHLPSK